MPFEKLGSVPLPDSRTPQQKEKDIDSILNWKRNPQQNDGPETAPFKKIDQMLPEKPGQSPEDRARDIDNVMTWLRNEGIDLVEDDSPESFKKIANLPMPDGRSPNQKAKDVDAILNWMRNPKEDKPFTSPFKKIDQLLPKRAGQSPEDRARDIDCLLYTSPSPRDS